MRCQQPERAEQVNIVRLLRSIGADVWPIGTTRRAGDYQGTMMAKGIPDIFAILPGCVRGSASRPVALWIEVKSPKGRLRPEQAQFREQCLAADLAHVVGGLDAVIVFLRTGGWVLA